MLEAVFGNANIEKVLFYLLRYGQGYARGIATAFETPLSPIQMQLGRLERGGVVVSRLAGRTRIYEMNPRYPFRRELEAFLNRAFLALPEAQVKKYYSNRSRPRRQGKP